MCGIREMRDLDDATHGRLGTYAEYYVNDKGELEAPDMDPFGETDIEGFEKFFEDDSGVGDAGEIFLPLGCAVASYTERPALTAPTGTFGGPMGHAAAGGSVGNKIGGAASGETDVGVATDGSSHNIEGENTAPADIVPKLTAPTGNDITMVGTTVAYNKSAQMPDVYASARNTDRDNIDGHVVDN
ncbi:hypothetical protein BDY19DRAFT_996265 [Irpex rosettiformis]|uniref:Uncharacterized protein n=1 Tax=Irpex rosettiformis TaxID=378272 RepID=A0ACB8TVW6_9APHY|nr:hypothetical protein BDY19DRAFT_996265 [Irpex rosettiformis]